MAVNALHATVIKAFRDRLASLGINPLEVIGTASLGRGATGSAQSPPTAHEVLESSRGDVRGHDISHQNRQWPGSCRIWYLRFRPDELLWTWAPPWSSFLRYGQTFATSLAAGIDQLAKMG